MGGGSTSQSALLRETQDSSSRSFDLRSWQGLTEVLRRGKEGLSSAEYAEFRNLVLHYAQQGGDAETREKIDTIIATFKEAKKVEKVSEDTKVEEKEVGEAPVASVSQIGSIGSRRIAPRFTPPSIPKVASTEKNTPRERATIPVREEVAPVVKVAPPPSPTHEAEVSTPSPVVVPPEKVEEKTVPSEVNATPVFRTLEEHKARIAEIKRLVHAEVGNPATLIDTHNDVGKTYMSALLSALKATGGGGNDVDSKMVELERAYTALTRDTREEVETPEEVTPLIPEERHESPLEVVNEVRSIEAEDPYAFDTPMPVKRESVTHDQKEEVTHLMPNIEPEIVSPPLVPEERDTQDVIHKTDEKILSVMRDIQKSKEVAEPEVREEQVVPPVDTREVPEPQGESRDVPILKARVEDMGVRNRHIMKGVGTRSVDDIKSESGVDPKEVAIKQTELSSPEITATLNQLLHEWSIFEGKGFFGTGPSGPEHPLYATLASLSMGEVVAGRFEGSNPKLVKTIKQYIDAWRHEQGIAYVITETFEHYLRRVVQRIVRRQKGEKDA